MISSETIIEGMTKHFRQLEAAEAADEEGKVAEAKDVQAKITEMFENGDDEKITVSGTDLLTLAEAIASIATKIGDNRALAIIGGLINKHIDGIESDAASAAIGRGEKAS